METLGIEPRAFRMPGGCDATAACALDRFKQNTRTHTVVTVASPPDRIRGCRIPHDSLATRKQCHEDRALTHKFAILLLVSSLQNLQVISYTL